MSDRLTIELLQRAGDQKSPENASLYLLLAILLAVNQDVVVRDAVKMWINATG